jgi:hypothetical protein
MPRPKTSPEALHIGNVGVVTTRSRTFVKAIIVRRDGQRFGAVSLAAWDPALDQRRRYLVADPTWWFGDPETPAYDAVTGASYATLTQHAYDKQVDEARAYVRDVAGLDLRGASPFGDPDMLLALADVLRPMIENGKPR